MEALNLLLMFFVVSGYSHVLQPKFAITEIAGLDSDTDRWSEWRTSISAEDRGNEKWAAVTSTEAREKEEEQRREEGLTPETDPDKKRMVEKERRDNISAGFTKTGDIDEVLDSNQGYKEISREWLTPETVSENMPFGEGAKREEDSTVADTEGGLIEYHLDTDTEGKVEGTEDGLESRTVNVILAENTEHGIIVQTVNGQNTEIQGERKNGQTDAEVMQSSEMETEKQRIEREETESKLVAGIGLHVERREDTHEDRKMQLIEIEKEDNVNKEEDSEVKKIAEEGADVGNEEQNKLAEREKEVPIVVNSPTPPLSTTTPQVEKDLVTPATLHFITQSQIPPPPPVHNNGPPTPPVTLPPVPPILPSHPPFQFTKVILQSFLPSVTARTPTTTNHVSALTVSPGQSPAAEVRSVSLVDDLLTEVLKVVERPGHHQKPLEVKVGPTVTLSISSEQEEDIRIKNIVRKPAPRDLQTTHKIQDAKETNTIIQPKETELSGKDLISKEQGATSKPKEAKFIIKDLNTTPKLKEPKPIAKSKVPQPTEKPQSFKSMENETKSIVTQNKASPAESHVAKSSAKPPLTQPNVKTPVTKPTKINRSNKNKKSKSKGKKGKKVNKTKKPSEEEAVTTPTYFPYFLDNYCPQDCACYGRVVQCSDKGMEKVPYGIPYNARYILLMNNHINSIQLNLLSEYISMEFLVLSNNWLTDGAIEGAFEGVPSLKRLYLDRNLLESVPTDLPASLEELRLDNNRLSGISGAAWDRCPGLLVLSLSNNSLGNGSESLPREVLSPLRNLRTLNLDHNQLASVPLGLPLSLKELYLRGNLIQQFRGGAFNGTSDLAVLDLSANRLTNRGLHRASLLNTTHLESLNLEGNRLKHVPRHLPLSLKTLNLEGNLISSINKATFLTLPNLEHLGLARNKIIRVATGAFRTLSVLHQLDLCHNALRHVPRQLPHGLHSAALTHNKIQSVPRDAFCWGDNTPSLSRLVRVQLENNLIDLGNLDAHAFRCLRGYQVVHFY